MAERLGAAIAAVPAGTDPEALSLAQSALGTMSEAAAIKDWPRAYGIGASRSFNGNIVRAGVNYHFNFAPAPVVAKY
jgi:hypothetical protein